MAKNSNAETVKKTKTELVVKATRALSTQEHKQISDKLRYEEEKSGLKIVLLPFTTELAEADQKLQEELTAVKDQLAKALEENKALQAQLGAQNAAATQS